MWIWMLTAPAMNSEGSAPTRAFHHRSGPLTSATSLLNITAQAPSSASGRLMLMAC